MVDNPIVGGWTQALVNAFQSLTIQRLGFFFSCFMLVISFLINNSDLKNYSFWSGLFFGIWASQYMKRDDYSEKRSCDNPLFQLGKLSAAMGFTSGFWVPWIQLIDNNTYSSNEGLIAFLFFIVISVIAGGILSAYILYAIDNMQLAGSILLLSSFLGLMCILTQWNFLPGTFIRFTALSFIIGYVASPVILYYMN